MKLIMKKFTTPFLGKKAFKRRHKECRICGEDTYELLDVHRIIHGGKYSNSNCACICTNCHRKHHSGLIDIKGWFNSTKGKLLLYIDEDDNEQFK